MITTFVDRVLKYIQCFWKSTILFDKEDFITAQFFTWDISQILQKRAVGYVPFDQSWQELEEKRNA